MVEYIRHILELIGIAFLETIRGLEDIQPTIDAIRSNRITSWVKYI